MGFVSNSSSSSFVLFGYAIDDNRDDDWFYKWDEIEKQIPERNGWSALSVVEGSVPKGKMLIGFAMDSGSDDQMTESNLDVADVIAGALQVAKAFGIEDVPMKVYSGARSC